MSKPNRIVTVRTILIALANGDPVYKVESTVNLLEPKVTDTLTGEGDQALINEGVKVNIK